jgi:hypothetical protein
VPRDPQAIRYAFFLSHVAEDSAVVADLKGHIERYSGRGGRPALSCFLDLENWPGGNVNSGVIKDFLFRSWHMAAWITPHYLANPRGWIWMELAYAELIELSLNLGNLQVTQPFIVPIFQGVSLEQIDRTPWVTYWERKLFVPDASISVSEIATKLVDFFEQEKAKRS